MEQYIPKSALVAEIDRLIKENELYLDYNVSVEVRYQKTGAYSVLCDILHFLNTLEVKEISEEYDGFLGKELKMIDDEITRLEKLKVKEVNLEKYLKEDIEDVSFDNGVAVKGATHYLTVDDVKEIAKHFFELGLKAKGE